MSSSITNTTTTQGVDACAGSGRPMRADARRNYDRLVTAARAVLSERGSEASMEEIAKTADVGVGTLYRHFPRRIDLIEAVYRDDVALLVCTADELVATASPWDALVGWLDAFVRYAQNKRVLLTELREAFERNPELSQGLRDKIAGAAAVVLTRAQQAGVARDDIDAADLMHLIGGMCMARAATLTQNERLLKLVLDGVRVS
jgi:AcrR family transcriptional regulator